MQLVITHALGRAGAKERLADGMARLAEEYGNVVKLVEHRWAGDRLNFTFEAMGSRASGATTVEDDRIVVKVDLPFGLRLFSGLAKDYLMREGTAFFASPGRSLAAAA